MLLGGTDVAVAVKVVASPNKTLVLAATTLTPTRDTIMAWLTVSEQTFTVTDNTTLTIPLALNVTFCGPTPVKVSLPIVQVYVAVGLAVPVNVRVASSPKQTLVGAVKAATGQSRVGQA